MSNAEGGLPRSLLTGPDWYPFAVRVPFGDIEFASLSADAYRRSPFLDHRIVRDSEAVEHLPFAAADALLAELPERTTHYVFHNAFACSTLLTRYLDALDGPLVLREPNSLYEVATLQRFAGTPIIRPLVGIHWDVLFALVRRLVGRRYRLDQPTIVKPTDGCNRLVPDLLHSDCQNRAVFIYAPFERFLASVLRHPPRHEWVRVRLRELLIDEHRRGAPLPVAPERLDVPQSAAMVWHLHVGTILRHRAEADARWLVVSADALVGRPEDILSAVVRHFGLPCSETDVSAAVRRTDTAANAKAADEAFDAVQRERAYQDAMSRFKRVIEDAAVWLRALHPVCDPREPLAGAIL